MNSHADELDDAIDVICASLRHHAEVLRASPGDPISATHAGEQVVQAVLAHEQALMRVAGWSSPLRHLGRLPAFEQSNQNDHATDEGGTPTTVTARYDLVVLDDDSIVNLARGRFADETIESLPAALKRLVEAEGWDPNQLSSNSLRMVSARVDVEA